MRPVVFSVLGAGLLLFVVLPVALVLRAGVAPEALSVDPDALLGTLGLVVGTVLLTAVAGTALGIAWARHSLPGWLVGAFLLAYATPPYVTTIAWIALANPTTGWLLALGPVDVYTLAGMVGVLGARLKTAAPAQARR